MPLNVCEAQATTKFRYRYTSMLTQCHTPGQVNTYQFDLGCNSDNQWTRIIFFDSLHAVTTNPNATLSTSLESRCGVCTNPSHPFLIKHNATIELDTHCKRKEQF